MVPTPPPGSSTWPRVDPAAPTATGWRSAASDGGTEPINGIIELGRRIAGGFRNFEHYRLRMLLITGGLDASPHTQL